MSARLEPRRVDDIDRYPSGTTVLEKHWSCSRGSKTSNKDLGTDKLRLDANA